MLDRRRFISACSGLGLTSTLFPGVLWALADGKEKITADMIDKAAAIADVPIPDDDRQMMLSSLKTRSKATRKSTNFTSPTASRRRCTSTLSRHHQI